MKQFAEWVFKDAEIGKVGRAQSRVKRHGGNYYRTPAKEEKLQSL